MRNLLLLATFVKHDRQALYSPARLTNELVLQWPSVHDNHWEACALKQLPIEMLAEQQAADSELEALGMPNMTQGLAAFKHLRPDTNQTSIWIAIRSVVLPT